MPSTSRAPTMCLTGSATASGALGNQNENIIFPHFPTAAVYAVGCGSVCCQLGVEASLLVQLHLRSARHVQL